MKEPEEINIMDDSWDAYIHRQAETTPKEGSLDDYFKKGKSEKPGAKVKKDIYHEVAKEIVRQIKKNGEKNGR